MCVVQERLQALCFGNSGCAFCMRFVTLLLLATGSVEQTEQGARSACVLFWRFVFLVDWRPAFLKTVARNYNETAFHTMRFMHRRKPLCFVSDLFSFCVWK